MGRQVTWREPCERGPAGPAAARRPPRPWGREMMRGGISRTTLPGNALRTGVQSKTYRKGHTGQTLTHHSHRLCRTSVQCPSQEGWESVLVMCLQQGQV